MNAQLLLRTTRMLLHACPNCASTPNLRSLPLVTSPVATTWRPSSYPFRPAIAA
jgi:hypothetical protein